MLFTKNTKHIKNITWSQLNHPSLSKRSTVCTRQDLGREHSILHMLPSCLMFTKSVTVGRGVVLIKHGSENQWTVLLGRIAVLRT